jgi:hypothetical protein
MGTRRRHPSDGSPARGAPTRGGSPQMGLFQQPARSANENVFLLPQMPGARNALREHCLVSRHVPVGRMVHRAEATRFNTTTLDGFGLLSRDSVQRVCVRIMVWRRGSDLRMPTVSAILSRSPLARSRAQRAARPHRRACRSPADDPVGLAIVELMPGADPGRLFSEQPDPPVSWEETPDAAVPY